MKSKRIVTQAFQFISRAVQLCQFQYFLHDGVVRVGLSRRCWATFRLETKFLTDADMFWQGMEVSRHGSRYLDFLVIIYPPEEKTQNK